MPTYTIQLSAGPVVSPKSTQNAAMQTALSLFVKAHGGPVNGTAQEQLDFVRDELISYVLETAKSNYRRDAVSNAGAQANVDVEGWRWE